MYIKLFCCNYKWCYCEFFSKHNHTRSEVTEIESELLDTVSSHLKGFNVNKKCN